MAISRKQGHFILMVLVAVVVALISIPLIYFTVREFMTGLTEVQVKYEMAKEADAPTGTGAQLALFGSTYYEHYRGIVHYAKGRERKLTIKYLMMGTAYVTFAWIMALGLLQRRAWAFKGIMVLSIVACAIGVSGYLATINTNLASLKILYIGLALTTVLTAWAIMVLYFTLVATTPESAEGSSAPPAEPRITR